MHHGHLDETDNVAITLRFCKVCGGFAVTSRSWRDHLWNADGYQRVVHETIDYGPLDDLAVVLAETHERLCELTDGIRGGTGAPNPPVPPSRS